MFNVTSTSLGDFLGKVSKIHKNHWNRFQQFFPSKSISKFFFHSNRFLSIPPQPGLPRDFYSSFIPYPLLRHRQGDLAASPLLFSIVTWMYSFDFLWTGTCPFSPLVIHYAHYKWVTMPSPKALSTSIYGPITSLCPDFQRSTYTQRPLIQIVK